MSNGCAVMSAMLIMNAHYITLSDFQWSEYILLSSFSPSDESIKNHYFCQIQFCRHFRCIHCHRPFQLSFKCLNVITLLIYPANHLAKLFFVFTKWRIAIRRFIYIGIYSDWQNAKAGIVDFVFSQSDGSCDLYVYRFHEVTNRIIRCLIYSALHARSCFCVLTKWRICLESNSPLVTISMIKIPTFLCN